MSLEFLFTGMGSLAEISDFDLSCSESSWEFALGQSDAEEDSDECLMEYRLYNFFEARNELEWQMDLEKRSHIEQDSQKTLMERCAIRQWLVDNLCMV